MSDQAAVNAEELREALRRWSHLIGNAPPSAWPILVAARDIALPLLEGDEATVDRMTRPWLLLIT